MAVSGSSNAGGGGSGGAGAVRAGAAYVEIFGRDSLSRVLDKIQAKTQAFASVVTRVGAFGELVGRQKGRQKGTC